MKKFRLPRKIKKKLSNKIFLYPQDSSGWLMAWPLHNQDDYNAYKKGICKDIMEWQKIKKN